MMGRVSVPSSSRLWLSVFCLAAFGLGTASVWAAAPETLYVGTSSDATATVTDCATAANTDCTLRDAITVANADGSGDTILFNSSLNGGTITLGSTLPTIAESVTITGPGAASLTVSGNNSATVGTIFEINSSGISVTISGLTIANGVGTCGGSSFNYGGGICLYVGSLALSGVSMTGNSASAGGAIWSQGTSLTVSSSTFSGNSASANGGGIAVGGGTATIINSTFYNNSAVVGGGATYNNGFATAITITNDTITGNSAAVGGGINQTGVPAASVNVTNSIVSGNSAPSSADISGAYTDVGGNEIGATGLKLAPFGNYGGPTQTLLPLPGSAAICAGLASDFPANTTSDQRGFPLTSGVPCSSSTAVDAGAVQTNYITVTNAGESNSAACPNTSKCTLRKAVSTAAGQGDIDFTGNGTSVTLSNGGLTLSLPSSGAAGVNIIGSATSPVKVDGGAAATAAGTVFTVNAGVPAVFWGLNITNGSVIGSGGGINNSGTLNLSYSAVSSNTSTGSGGGIYNSGSLSMLASTVANNSISATGDGGGIVNASGAMLTVLDSTISGNSTSTGSGGGIYSGGTLNITESTISGNTATDAATAFGGGIDSGGTLTIVNSTISGNKVTAGGGSDQGGGIFNDSGTASLKNTIVAGNTSDGSNADIGGYTDNGTSGNVIGGTVKLAVLGTYGPNAIQTQIPLPGGTNGNPAICAGLSADVPSTVIDDERGEPISPNDCPAGAVDAGAVQTSYTMSFTASPTGTNTVNAALTPAPAVTLDESGAAFASASSVSIPMTMTGGTLYGGTSGTTVTNGTATAGTNASGVATYSGVDSTAGNGLSLTATLQLNSAVAALSALTATSGNFNVNQATTTVTVTGPSTGTVATAVTFTGTVSPQNPTVPLNLDGTGTVTFTDSTHIALNCDDETVTITSGVAKATCTTTGLNATSQKVYAVYNGDSNYLGSSANSGTPASITVSKAATAVTVTEGAGFPTNPTYGASLTFNAAVTPLDASVPFSTSGTVTFYDALNGGTPTVLCSSGTFTVSTGIATCTTTTLGIGTHSITAVYNANSDPNYLTTQAGAETALTGLDITQATPTVDLTCSSNPNSGANCTQTITQGASETFTAVVNGVQGLSAPTGNVEFTDNGTAIAGCGGTTGVALTNHAGNKQAQCAVTLGGGTHGIVATYLPDSGSSYVSALASMSVTVGAGTSVTVFTSPDPNTTWTSTVNAMVNFVGTVTAQSPSTSNPDPQGTVTVFYGTTALSGCVNQSVVPGPGTSQSTFSCQTQYLPLGADTIQAKFTSTDTNSYGNSVSQTKTMTVSAGTSTTTVASSSNPAIVNNPIDFTASVTAPSGPILPQGNVTFTAQSTTTTQPVTTLCSQVPLGVTSGTTTGTAKCTGISNLAADTYIVTATYTDTNSNFTTSSGTVTPNQVVSASATKVAIQASPSNTTVNTTVTYTITVTADSSYPLTGPLAIADNGTAICTTNLTLISSTGSPQVNTYSCTENNLTAGVHTISAIYNASSVDLNNGTGSGSTTVSVAPQGTVVTVTSSQNPSVVNNPAGYKDTVTFIATVAPASGTANVALTGNVTFLENGVVIENAGCLSPVTVVSGMATCTTTSLPAGADTILAVYNNDPNYSGSSGYLTAPSTGQIAPQAVQDYSLVISSTPPVVISQGYSTSTDLFSPQTISVVPLSIEGFGTQPGQPLNLNCTVSAVFSPVSTPTLPLCKPATATLAVNSNGAQGAVSIVVDGCITRDTNGNCTQSASPGIYTVTETGVDPTTQLGTGTSEDIAAHSSSFQVTVNAATDPVTVVSGATTGNTGNLTFMLPAGITLSNLECLSVSGPNLTGSVTPASLGITCTFNPTSITNSGTGMAAELVSVTVSTGGSTTTTAAASRSSNLWFAGLLGLPLFGLMGLIRGRKSKDSVFFRLLVVAIICVMAFQAVGCGGSFSTQPSNAGSGGTTPPGVYKVLVVGTGSDGQTYQALLQLNVQL